MPYHLPSFEGVPPEALDLWSWYHLVCSVGCVLWCGAYIAYIWKAYRTKLPTLPATCMCLNFGWESMYWLLPNFNVWWPILNLGWLLLDCILVVQLIRYARNDDTYHPLLRNNIHWLFPIAVVFSVAGQLAFVITFQDRLGLIDAFFINFVMSILFVAMFFRRRGGRGQTLLGAVLRLLGSFGAGIGALVFVPLMNLHIEQWPLLLFLVIGICVFDSVYVILLIRDRIRPGFAQ